MSAVTTSPTPAANALIDALNGPHPEPALEQAFAKLGGGFDWSFLVCVVKALVRVNLTGVAVRLLRTISGGTQLVPQIALLVDELQRLPSGEIPQAELQRRYAANRSALLRRFAHLRATLPEDAPNDVRIFASAKGNLHAVRDVSGGGLNLVFPFADQIAQAAALELPAMQRNSGAFVLNGVPNLAIWTRLLALQSDSGYVPPVDVIETDPGVLCIWLMMGDVDGAFDDERVSFFVGANALDQYREFLTDHDWRLNGLYCIINGRPGFKPPAIDQRFNESVAAAAKARRSQVNLSLQQRYAGHDAQYWRRRFHDAFHSGSPLQVVGFTSRYSTVMQHAMRDLGAAFQRRGCGFLTVMQANRYEPTVDVAAALRKSDVDLIIVINHLRSEFADAMPANVPYLCWIQDHMDQLCNVSAGRSVGELDLVLAHSPGVLTSQYGYSAASCLATTNLTDPHTFSNDPLPDAELAPYRCDVSYVSHGWQSADSLIETMSRGADAVARFLRQFVELVEAALHERGSLSIGDRLRLMSEAERRTGSLNLSPQARARTIYPATECLFDRVFRHQALEWTAKWARSRGRTFRIHGKGWDNHATLGEFAAGEIENGGPLRALYQASSISLQINGYQSLHQRLLDGIASGGFVLSRYHPGDFHRVHLLRIQRAIREHGVTNLADFMSGARNIADLGDAVAQAEQCSGLRIAPLAAPGRAREAQLLRTWGFWPEWALSDEGMFELLATMKLYVHRSAGEIPGFNLTTFSSERELHDLLDRYVDDAEARRQQSRPMRESIINNDTYDQLVDRILNHFQSRFAQSTRT